MLLEWWLFFHLGENLVLFLQQKKYHYSGSEQNRFPAILTTSPAGIKEILNKIQKEWQLACKAIANREYMMAAQPMLTEGETYN